MGRRLIAFGMLAAVWAIHAQALRAADKTAVRFRLLNGYAIVVKGSIGPLRGLHFLLDTGAVPTVINRRIAKKLHLNGSSSTLSLFARRVDARSVIVPDIRIGPVTAKSVAVLTKDLSDLEARWGTRVDAMIGLDVFRARSFRIDYKSRKLLFDLPVAPKFSCPIQTRPGFAYVIVSVQGKRITLVLDTGAKDLILFSSRIAGRLEGLRTSAGKTVYNMGGDLALRKVHLHGVRLGDETPREVEAFVLDSSAQSAPGFDGLLGVRALGLSEVAFDFERNRLLWR